MKPIGILGGMGPEATNKMAQLIFSITPAASDQDHIPLIVWNNAALPHRLNAIWGDGESPVPLMIQMAQQLEMCGATHIVMPCNTAHYFIPQIQPHVRIPFINFMQQTVDHILQNYACTKVGVLGTNVTTQFGLYKDALQAVGLTVVDPSIEDQQAMTDAIYLVKSGQHIAGKAIMDRVADTLVANGAECIIMGCTEIPLVMKSEEHSVPMVDPSYCVALKVLDVANENMGVNESEVMVVRNTKWVKN